MLRHYCNGIGRNFAVTARFAIVGEEDRGGGFDLLLGDRVILSHRVEAPAFRIARGNPTVTMVRGNFRHEDAPTDERVPRYVVHKARGIAGLACSATHNPLEPELLVSWGFEGGPMPPMLSILAVDRSFDRIAVDFCAGNEEVIWGGGEQISYLALNGRRFPMWTSEPGVGRDPGSALTKKMDADGSFAGGDYWTTNYPDPTIISSGGYAIRTNVSVYSELNLSAPAKLTIAKWSGFFLAEFYEGSPAEIVRQLQVQMLPPTASDGSDAQIIEEMVSWRERLTQKAGPSTFQHCLPNWSTSGAIIGLKDGDNSFARLEKIIAAGTAVSAIWCEDWCGIRQTSFGRRLFWDWQWQPARYPDLLAKMAELKARGIRFLGYVNPYLATDGPLFAEAAAKGYFARRLDSDDPYLVDFGEFDAGVVDFTNPDAADWFAEEVIGKRMVDFGLDGWMADFGEYLPVDLRLHHGDPMEMHNQWPVLWAEVNHRAVASRGKTGDILWFMRAGFTGSQQYCPLLWAGDQSVDFSRHDGIGTVITAALSAGLVGNAFSHSDVGGYTSLHGNVRTEELLYRWYELGAFTPVMRTHEGNRPEDNLQIDSTPELLRGFARWSRVHAALAPWVRHLIAEAQATGLPAQRALFLHYPDDRETFTIQDQYLYGADLMVAPVIEEGATSRCVYLPGDAATIWRHVWSGRDWSPGWHDVPAPIGEPPVFYTPDSTHAALFARLRGVRDSL
jgi:sulfoquinovosidase